MNNKINILFLFLMSAFLFTACEEEVEEFTGPYQIIVAGPHEVVPGTEETYTIGDILEPESYTWTVQGPAQIVGENTGSVVDVEFGDAGDAVLKVTNGVDSATVLITVAEIEPAVAAELDSTGVLSEGEADTVLLNFDAPLAAAPKVVMNTEASAFIAGTEAFVSGSISAVEKVDDDTYAVIYTAGPGNGIPEALITGIESTPMYGSVTIDSAYVQLYEVDNVDPLADVSYSQTNAKDSTVVTITATFSEPVMFESTTDSTLYVAFEGAGVKAERRELMPTDNPLVYTYDYVVNGEGNGVVEVSFDNIVDFGRNPLTESAVTNTNALVVDNITPGISGSATAEDDYAVISISSNEPGIGVYVIMDAEEEAPADAAALMEAEGVVNGTVTLVAEGGLLGNYAGVANELLGAGDYVVYYLVQDEAGNASEIESDSLTME